MCRNKNQHPQDTLCASFQIFSRNDFDFSGPNLPKKEFSVVYLEN